MVETRKLTIKDAAELPMVGYYDGSEACNSENLRILDLTEDSTTQNVPSSNTCNTESNKPRITVSNEK